MFSSPLVAAIFLIAFLLATGVVVFVIRELRKSPPPPRPASSSPPRPTTVATPATKLKHTSVNSVIETPKAPPTETAKLYRRAQMTRSESAFYDFLKMTVQDQYILHTKPPLRDLFKRYGWLEKELYTMHARGHVDFVLLEPTLKNPIIAIELDGTTHNDPTQIDRDRRKEELFRRADMKLLRFQTGKIWGEAERQQINQALPKPLDG